MKLEISLGVATGLSLAGCGSPTKMACTPFQPGPRNGYTTLTGGLKIGPSDSSQVGSLGIIVYDRETGRPMALTNGHVAYGRKPYTAPFPKGSSMAWKDGPHRDIGTLERGEWAGDDGMGGLPKAPDFAVSNIEYNYFDSNARVLGLLDKEAIGGIGSTVFNQRVKFFNNVSPIAPNDPPIGIVYGRISNNREIISENTNQKFAVSGNSGSVVIEAETNTNLVVGQIYATLPSGTAYFQSIKTVLDRNVNPNAVDAKIYDPDKHPVAIFRYKDAEDNARLYTTNWQEFNLAGFLFKYTKKFEYKAEGAIFKNKLMYKDIDMIPLFRFYNQITNDTIYTNSLEEISRLEADADWCNYQPIGYMPPGPISEKIVPFYRYYNSSLNQHFYTINQNDPVLTENSSWALEDTYWVFAQHGDPDPTAYTGPAHADIVLNPLCSTAKMIIDGQSGETTLTGTVGITIGPDCVQGPCDLTIAKMQLRAEDFSVGGHAISQAELQNYGYAAGTWRDDNTFSLSKLSTSVVSTFKLDGKDSAISLTNASAPLLGTLNRDYSNFDLYGDFGKDNNSLHLSLCGKAVAHPPQAVLSPLGPFQCTSPAGAQVIFSSAQSSDPDNDIEHRVWTIDNQTVGTDVITLPTTLPLGEHSVSVLVADGRRVSSTASAVVSVVDSTPPQVTASTSPSCLFPPNHKYALFTLGDGISISAKDSCDPAPQTQIVSVTSNQPPLGGGSGNTAPDFKFGNSAFCIRAERNGTGQTPREYTVTLEVKDHAGNKTNQKIIIAVPHDQGGMKCDKPEVVVEDDDPRCTQNAAQ